MAIHISFCKSTSFQTVLRRLSFALRRSPDKAVHFFFKKKNNNKQNQSAMDCISVGLLLIPLLKPQQRRTLAFPCRTFLGFCSCWSTLQKKICLKKNKLLSKNTQNFLQRVFNAHFQKIVYLEYPQEGLTELPPLKRIPSSLPKGNKIPEQNASYEGTVAASR